MAEGKEIKITWGEFKAWKDKNLRRSGVGDETLIYGRLNKGGSKAEFRFDLFRWDRPKKGTDNG